MAASDLVLPAEMVRTAAGLPAVCTRHGEPAARRTRTTFQSSPPPWAFILLVVGVLPFLIVTTAMRKQLVCAAWPFCARCVSSIRTLRWVSLGLILGAVAAVVGGIALAGTDNALVPWLILLGLLLFVASLIVLTFTGPGRVARAEVTRDGFALLLRKAAPGFAAALPRWPPLAEPPPTWGSPPPLQPHR
jgi:hypothetical protein